MSTADPVAAFRHREPGGYVRPDPDAMAAVAALERCLRMRDYAGAAQLVRQRKVADGLGILAAMARRSWAEQAYWRSVAEWRAEHEATVRARLERDVAEIVALVAEVVTEADARSAGWPVTRIDFLPTAKAGGFQRSPAGVPASRPTADGVSRAV